MHLHLKASDLPAYFIALPQASAGQSEALSLFSMAVSIKALFLERYMYDDRSTPRAVSEKVSASVVRKLF